MPAGPLRDDLLAMAASDGVPVEDVLVADASRRTTALNAYVSGFGATRRIVVYDTLLQAPADRRSSWSSRTSWATPRHGDVLYGTLVGGLAAALGASCCSWRPPRVPCGGARASPRLADPRAVGVLMGLLSLATVLSGPGQNLVSRHIEARADLHALDLTKDPATFVSMQKRLAITNISDLSPDAVEYVLYASHPTAPAAHRHGALLGRAERLRRAVSR